MKVLLLLVVLPLAWAQFPAVCNNDVSLMSKTCCPNNCFRNESRGMCIDVTTTVMEGWKEENGIVEKVCNRDVDGVPQDVRCQWPIRVFNMVCSCTNGWGGYDCSQCDFGYILNAAGDRCVKRTDNQLRVRRNFISLTTEKQKKYISVLRRAKNEAVKEWSVVVEEPTDSSGTVKLQDVSVYDMLVIHHFLATREKDNEQCNADSNFNGIDFAHEGPTFLTWHRYYLLIVERELHRVAKDMGINGFELAYWDWSSSENIFESDLFGTPDYSSTPDTVSGGLFNGDDWPVLCNDHYEEFLADKNGESMNRKDCAMVRKLCNVSANRAEKISLRRGFIKSQKPSDKPFLPDSSTIKMALTAREYTGDTGFGNRTEGFVELCTSRDNGQALCRFRITDGKTSTHNNLHNAVHIYIGGHMRDVPTASNDPIFFLHHANIDRIFEAWLRKFNSGSVPNYEPDGGAVHPGHGYDDYLVPFFPLRTNKDMYNLSSHLGFQYDTLPEIAFTDSDNLLPCPFPRIAESCKCYKGGTPGAVNSDTNPTSNTNSPSRTTSPPSRTTPPNPGSQGSGFHVSLYLISVAGTCAVLIVSKLSDIL